MPVTKLKQFIADEGGATAIEYGLIAAIISMGIIGSFTLLSNGLTNLFGTTETGAGAALKTAADSIK